MLTKTVSPTDALWLMDAMDIDVALHLDKIINISLKRTGFFQTPLYDKQKFATELWAALSKTLSAADKPDDVYLASEAGLFIPLDVCGTRVRLYNAENLVTYVMA